MNNDLVSVIIPVFNVEKYIERCINSVLQQTYKNIEIILINDGSKDKSGEICDKYANLNKSIKVYHQSNKGGSIARNLGIKNSNGKYICFIDSDDLIEEKYIETLRNNMDTYNAQLSVCGYKKFSLMSELSEKVKSNEKTEIYENSEIYSILLNNNFGGFFGGKMFLKDVILKMDSYINEKIFVCEDFEFVARYAQLCEKAVFQKEKLYFYFKNNGSLTGNTLETDKFSTIIDAYKSVEDVYKKNAPELIEYVYYEDIRARMNLNYRYYLQRKKFFYKDKVKYKYILQSKKINLKKKIYMILSYNFPIITSKIKYYKNNNKKGKKL